MDDDEYQGGNYCVDCIRKFNERNTIKPKKLKKPKEKTVDYRYCSDCGKSTVAVVIGTNGKCSDCNAMSAPCPDCLLPHPAHLCPKKLAADKDNDKSLSDWDRLKNRVDDLNADINLLGATVKSLTGSIDNLLDMQKASHDIEASHDSMIDRLDRRLGDLESSRPMIGPLRDEVATLDRRLRRNLTAYDGLMDRLRKRVEVLEDRLSPPQEATQKADPDFWLRYRISDLKSQIAADEAMGRNTALLHAAKRMVKHLEETPTKESRLYDVPKMCNCGHMVHPGQQCLFRMELPGETYECPCDDAPLTDRNAQRVEKDK